MGRLWTIAVIAEAFHVSPFQVARELDRDPEQLNLVCLQLLKYAEAKRAEERGEDMDLWKGSKMMDSVLQNRNQLLREKRKKWAEKHVGGA